MFDVLGTDFVKLGTVENPSSANYSIYWQEVGGLTLIAAATANNLQMLVNDRYLLVNDTMRRGVVNETVYVIANVSVNEEKAEITVNGKTADYLLHGRAVQPLVLANTRARHAVAQMVNDNVRGLPMVAAVRGELADTEIIRYPMDGGALDEATMELMQYCGIGKSVCFARDHFVYAAESGRDLTGLEHIPVFGSGSGTARSPTISIDTSDYCNVATATLNFNDNRAEFVSYGDAAAAGISRRELYCGSIMQESDETVDEFRARAKAEAEGMLAEHIKRFSVSADIDAADLAAFYQLGDIVPVRVGGYTLKKRITGITWLKDQMNDKVSIKLGDPIMTVIAEIKEKKPVSKAISSQIGGLRSRATAVEEKTKLIQEDYESLIARVDGVVAGMDAYVLNKTFEEYKMAVTRTFATIDGVNAELRLYASKDDLQNTAEAVTTLTARVKDSEAKIELKASQASVNTLSKAVATVQADVINLQGDVNVGGNLTLTDGNIIALTEIIAAHGLTIGTDHSSIYGKDYKPREITATAGTVRVLGLA